MRKASGIKDKKALRSIGFIGARPASTVAADTTSSAAKSAAPAKSRGAIKPQASATPAGLSSNIRKPGGFRLK
ncbi:hypothetical protein [Martelella mediterranea]|uniref:Uncharacterized protein n=1 Tax=Martelella mediterranea TaxID=293089 RepID=A0A4R3P0L8_9HYPH|nr:hypothetical protein [Martelella mediterranea]TCT42127.1 hypothetical protein EDC90_1005142 [Martelella mediterranea]